MTHTGSKALDDTEFDIVLREVDKNGNGVVDFNEFRAFLLEGQQVLLASVLISRVMKQVRPMKEGNVIQLKLPTVAIDKFLKMATVTRMIKVHRVNYFGAGVYFGVYFPGVPYWHTALQVDGSFSGSKFEFVFEAGMVSAEAANSNESMQIQKVLLTSHDTWFSQTEGDGPKEAYGKEAYGNNARTSLECLKCALSVRVSVHC